MHWIDGHLDLAYLHVGSRDIRQPCDNSAIGCVSLPALRAAGVQLALATIFIEPGPAHDIRSFVYQPDDPASAEAAALRQVQAYRDLQAAREIDIVRSAADFRRPSSSLKIIILMEGADPIADPSQLRAWVDRGVRAIGLTWASGTRYAGGNHVTGPLTALGRELIAEMDGLGLIHDLSHLSDEACDEALTLARGPVMASHSNCRALVTDNQRHLRDETIVEIGRRGGIVGLNLYSKFLAVGRRATIDDCVRHVQRVAELMGHRRGVGLGSDMDGGFAPESLPIGLDHPSKLDALAAALRAAGWSDEDVAGFTHGNWMRFLGEGLEETDERRTTSEERLPRTE